MVPALPGPVDGQVCNVIPLSGLSAAGRGSPGRGPLRAAASPGVTMPELAEYVVNRLFSVGLSLESARCIVGAGRAGDRIASASDEVDHMIRDIRAIMFSRAADPAAP
jgi:hypothetical protein